MDTERKSFPFELEEKGIDEEQRTIKGYAAVTGNIDEGKDVIDRGAFKKTLQESGGRVKAFYIHDFQEPIGKPVELAEVPRSRLPKVLQEKYPDATGGLHTEFKIERTRRGEDAWVLAKAGILDEMSIGYQTVKEEWEELGDGHRIRHIKELKLFDVSLVPLAMNAAAVVTEVKEQERQMEQKSVVGFQDLALADEDMGWDAGAARKRVAAWAGGPDKEDINWGKFQKAFVWYDAENPEQMGSYHLGIGDIVDGSLKAVPRGIFAVAVVLSGGRGGWTKDVDGCKAHIAKYYKKMDRDVPWKALSEIVEKAEAGYDQLYAMLGHEGTELGEVGKALLVAQITKYEREWEETLASTS